jgi:hypothetical protein
MLSVSIFLQLRHKIATPEPDQATNIREISVWKIVDKCLRPYNIRPLTQHPIHRLTETYADGISSRITKL